jgi:hypothetical protein
MDDARHIWRSGSLVLASGSSGTGDGSGKMKLVGFVFSHSFS